MPMRRVLYVIHVPGENPSMHTRDINTQLVPYPSDLL